MVASLCSHSNSQLLLGKSPTGLTRMQVLKGMARAAHGGQVLCSGATFAQINSRLIEIASLALKSGIELNTGLKDDASVHSALTASDGASELEVETSRHSASTTRSYHHMFTKWWTQSARRGRARTSGEVQP